MRGMSFRAGLTCPPHLRVRVGGGARVGSAWVTEGESLCGPCRARRAEPVVGGSVATHSPDQRAV